MKTQKAMLELNQQTFQVVSSNPETALTSKMLPTIDR